LTYHGMRPSFGFNLSLDQSRDWHTFKVEMLGVGLAKNGTPVACAKAVQQQQQQQTTATPEVASKSSSNTRYDTAHRSVT
jgi:hypothetical protein